MRLSFLVSIIFVLAASLLAYAAPFGAPPTFLDIEQRSLAQLLEPRGGHLQHSNASNAHDTQLMLNVIFRSRVITPQRHKVRNIPLAVPRHRQGRFFCLTRSIDDRLTANLAIQVLSPQTTAAKSLLLLVHLPGAVSQIVVLEVHPSQFSHTGQSWLGIITMSYS